MTEICSQKILIGKDAIKKYLNISEPTFKKFITLGMPARVIDSRWYAHTENLELFFKQMTISNDGDAPEDAE